MKSKPAKKTAKTAMTASQSATKKVFDVTRPGKTPVSPTSRPVIVGHKPQVKDPMMSDRDDERPLLDSSKKVTIAPAADAAAPDLPATPVLPPSDADSGGLPSANPSLAQEGSRTDTVAGDAKGGAQLPQASAEHIGKATDAAGPASGGSKEEVAAAPEVPEAEKPTEPSAADSVATIATSSVVDDVPPPQEDTATPKPTEPLGSGNTTSGLVFDDLDGAGEPNLTKPSPVAGGTDGGAPGAPQPSGEHDGEASVSDRTRTDEGSAGSVVGQAVVSHHKQSGGAGKVFAVLFVVLILAIVAFDILLDMGILNMTNLPHTNFLPSN